MSSKRRECNAYAYGPCHICTRTGLTPAHICTRTGLAPAHIGARTTRAFLPRRIGWRVDPNDNQNRFAVGRMQVCE